MDPPHSYCPFDPPSHHTYRNYYYYHYRPEDPLLPSLGFSPPRSLLALYPFPPPSLCPTPLPHTPSLLSLDTRPWTPLRKTHHPCCPVSPTSPLCMLSLKSHSTSFSVILSLTPPLCLLSLKSHSTSLSAVPEVSLYLSGCDCFISSPSPYTWYLQLDATLSTQGNRKGSVFHGEKTSWVSMTTLSKEDNTGYTHERSVRLCVCVCVCVLCVFVFVCLCVCVWW